MDTKIYKKLREKEEKLLQAIYDIQEFLDSTEDAELSSMGAEFCELMVDFCYENDTITLKDIKETIENYD